MERLTARVEEFCAANALDGEAAFQLNLALEELFVNSVRHGGCDGMADALHVRLRPDGGGVQVEFRDRGRAFDPTGAPAAVLMTPLAERRGRRTRDSPGARNHARHRIPARGRMECAAHAPRRTGRATANGGAKVVIETKDETRSGWLVVHVRGRADAESADALEEALKAAVGKSMKVAADCAGLDYISSAGLRAVIQAARAAEGLNVEFAVCSLKRQREEGLRHERTAPHSEGFTGNCHADHAGRSRAAGG